MNANTNTQAIDKLGKMFKRRYIEMYGTVSGDTTYIPMQSSVELAWRNHLAGMGCGRVPNCWSFIEENQNMYVLVNDPISITLGIAVPTDLAEKILVLGWVP